MKLTRIIIPVLTFATTTLLVAQGQPEPFPTPGDPLPAPAPAAVPKPSPAPVTPPPTTPNPVVPNPIPAPIPTHSAVPSKATLLAPQQPVSDPSIGLGTVRGTKVSARGKATIFSALVFQFNRNEPLNILEEITITNPKAGEPRKWYRVQVPPDAGLWVHSNYLNPATTIAGINSQGQQVKLNVAEVKANLLNVRGGSGEEFPILSKLPQGAQVVLTGASKGKWREVLAPQNASVYVAAQFVTRQKITAGVVEIPQPNVNTPAVTPSAINPAAAPVKPTSPVQPSKPATPPASVVPVEIKKFGQNNPQSPGGIQIKGNPSTKKPQPATSPAKPTVTAKPKETVKPIQLAKVNPALPTPTTTKPITDKPVRIVHREGIIRRTLDIQSPSGYVLEHLESGKKINYLVLDKKVALKLNWFVGKKVLVTGEEALDARNTVTPVLLVSTLKGELTKGFIAKIATARSEAVKKAKKEELKQPPANDQTKASDQPKEASEEK